MYVRSEIRISDADRDAMTNRLATAFAEGRIATDELEARLEAVLGATTASELAEVARDLPRPRSATPVPTRHRVRRPLSLLDVQLLIVTPVVALTLLVAINTGTFIWPTWVWLVCAAPIVLWLVSPSMRPR